MTEKLSGTFTLTSPVVMTFPNLLEAKAFMKNGKAKGDPKYSANFVFDAEHPDLKGMKELAAKVARAKWPDTPFSELKFPFISGDKLADKRKAKDKTDGEWQRGKLIISAKSKLQPRLSYLDGGKIVDLETDLAKSLAKDKFFNGAEVLAQFNFWAYEKGDEDSKNGVTAYLNLVLSTGKGKRLSGGQTASEVFKGYAGSVSAEDPTGGDSLDDVVGM